MNVPCVLFISVRMGKVTTQLGQASGLQWIKSECLGLALVLSLPLCGLWQVTTSVCLILSFSKIKTMPFLYLFHGEVRVH